jgi:hypothetical protein
LRGDSSKLWLNDDVGETLAMATGDIDGDGASEVAVGSGLEGVHMFNADGSLRWNFPVDRGRELALVLADIYGDDNKALIVGGSWKDCNVFAVDASGKAVWTYFVGFDVSSIHHGDIDGDMKDEFVVLADGMYVLDDDGTEIWKEYQKVGRNLTRVCAADVDGDGDDEAVICDGRLYVYELDGTPLWGYDTASAWTLAACNIDADDAEEVVVGCYDGSVYLFDNDGAPIWQAGLNGIRCGVTAGDMDRDGMDEIGAVDGTVYIFDASGNLKSEISPERDRYAAAIAFGDLDGKEGEEIVCCYQDSVCGYDKRGIILWGYRHTRLNAQWVIVADIDSHPGLEVIAASQGGILCVGGNGQRTWFSEFSKSAVGERDYRRSSRVATADVNGDGFKDIVLGGYRKVTVLGNNGEKMWSCVVDGDVRDIVAADIDGDRRPEIIAAARRLYVLDNEGRIRWKFLGGRSFDSVAICTAGQETYALAGADCAYLLKFKKSSRGFGLSPSGGGR